MNDHPVGSTFRSLFETHFSYVWSVLRRLGVKSNDTEDLVHEVFLSVYRHLCEYDPERPIRPWLFGFAFRVASDDRRRARHRHEVVDAEAVSSFESKARADDELILSEDRSLLLRALDELALDRRAVLVMHEWDGCTIPEVARALRIPLNTAYTRLRLARADLSNAVKRLARCPPPAELP